jgi:hypothetical protein
MSLEIIQMCGIISPENYLIVRNYLTRDYLIVRNYLACEITDRNSEGASGRTDVTNRYPCYVKVQP